VSHLALLYWRMLRYRVAVMIVMFMLLGAARADGLVGSAWGLVWAALALASSYVAATTINDVADREIDLVNHPRDSGRPLVSGDASERELLALHRVSSLLALAAAVPLGWLGVGIVGVSLTIGRAYSAPPILLSHRTYLAPIVLGIAYVLVPYGLGLAAVGTRPSRADAGFAAALFALFVARIVLKDFRDRAGDSRYGRPTLLLRFGKTATCSVSLLALVAGDALLVMSVAGSVGAALLVQLFAAAVGAMLYRLWRSVDLREEQVAIGIGARMGNGLLLAVLGWLVLAARGAAVGEELAFAGTLAAVFGTSFVLLVTHPDEVVLGYKG